MGASQYGGEFPYASGHSKAPSISRSTLSQRKREFSLLTLLGGRPQAASLVRGLRPRNAPSNNMPRRPGVDNRDKCPIERIQPNQNHPVPSIPRRSRPCACPEPTKSKSVEAGPGFGACPLSLQKAIDNSSPRWHDFPARLIPPQIWNAPQKTVEQTRFPCFIDQG